MCTVLLADRVPGLQIVGPDGRWHDVLPSPGALLVNLGDLMAQWTNDRWRSTLHRVLPPAHHPTEVRSRRSVAFFHDGNHDALIECLPTCVLPGAVPKYAPVVAGEHLMAKLMGPRLLTPSSATDTTGGRLDLLGGRARLTQVVYSGYADDPASAMLTTTQTSPTATGVA